MPREKRANQTFHIQLDCTNINGVQVRAIRQIIQAAAQQAYADACRHAPKEDLHITLWRENLSLDEKEVSKL